jgi:hypothetical protein
MNLSLLPSGLGQYRTAYLVWMPTAGGKSHSSGFRNKATTGELFVAPSGQRGYNRAVRAFPRVVAGYCMPPTTKRKPLQVDSAEVAYDVN